MKTRAAPNQTNENVLKAESWSQLGFCRTKNKTQKPAEKNCLKHS